MAWLNMQLHMYLNDECVKSFLVITKLTDAAFWNIKVAVRG